MENNDNFQSNQNETASSTNEDLHASRRAYSGSGSSPEEVKTRVKDAVAKGVAAVAGALKGFTEEAQKHDLANTTKSAIQKAGEATRQVAGTATAEIKKTKDHVMQSARDSGLSKSGGASLGSAGSGSSWENSGSRGIGGSTSYSSLGSTGGSTTDLSPKLPDLSKVDLGKTDEELK